MSIWGPKHLIPVFVVPITQTQNSHIGCSGEEGFPFKKAEGSMWAEPSAVTGWADGGQRESNNKELGERTITRTQSCIVTIIIIMMITTTLPTPHHYSLTFSLGSC